MRIRDFALLLAVIATLAACSAQPATRPPEKDWVGQLVAYQKVVYAGQRVGFVKVVEYRQEAYEDTFRLYHVVDPTTFRECGIINDSGTGTRYIWLAPDIARAKGYVRDEEPLAARPFADNVATLLGVPGPVEIQPATEADFVPPPAPAN